MVTGKRKKGLVGHALFFFEGGLVTFFVTVTGAELATFLVAFKGSAAFVFGRLLFNECECIIPESFSRKSCAPREFNPFSLWIVDLRLFLRSFDLRSPVLVLLCSIRKIAKKHKNHPENMETSQKHLLVYLFLLETPVLLSLKRSCSHLSSSCLCLKKNTTWLMPDQHLEETTSNRAFTKRPIF